MNKLTDRQFKNYCDIVYSECGINLTDEKRELLNARIAKRLRKLEITPDKYFTLIKSDSAEMKIFMDAISTNHTYFFRESKSFKYMDNGCRDIWCAASSSGEEPYSLAMYCMELGYQPSILATDISESCLKTGKTAIYPGKAMSSIPRHM
ncbi:MAG: chemotaxis protein CheR, partial [Deltaproteobacteria bacterium]|nr:chemotaxis protein CheR [Deltaproteobacteria bacterium]